MKPTNKVTRMNKFLKIYALVLFLFGCASPQFGQTVELTQAKIDSRFTGNGTFQYKNLDDYSGDWLKGEKHGKGIYRFGNDTENRMAFSGFSDYIANNAVVYDGDWTNDKANGIGTMRFINSVYNISSEYIGEWQDGYFHGQGKLSFSTGNYYDGSWVEGFKMGAGRVYTEYWDGEIYEGETFNNDRRGLGKLTYPNGDVYVGEMNVHPNGKGTMTYADGRIVTGVFKNGKYVSPE